MALKRSASNPLLHARGAKRVSREGSPHFHQDYDQPTLWNRWVALAVDTARAALNTVTKIEPNGSLLPTTSSSNRPPHPSSAPSSSIGRSTPLPNGTQKSDEFRPPLPRQPAPRPLDTSLSPNGQPISSLTTPTTPEPFSFSSASSETGPLSVSSSVASSSAQPTLKPTVTITDMWSPRELALEHAQKRHGAERLRGGIAKKGGYKKKSHIHARLHKAQVEENMKQELYALQRAGGYTSDYATFQGYLGYREQLEELQKKDAILPISATPRTPSSSSVRVSSPSTSQSEKQITDDLAQISLKPSSSFLERALKKARDSIDSPRPPKPQAPVWDRLRLDDLEKDAAIDRRIRPPPKRKVRTRTSCRPLLHWSIWIWVLHLRRMSSIDD
ncbi:hypothetical protein BOTBODRAFT_34245 [Botryobasidium botryosum FD-172 SS1]|uniref:Uncharacterized protein n=1 Tax=Botryobasidium botryosum (strain FD-172 SS1) TaxID=930990 RepID=A0A067MB45_BOTB1|nr:hypothetical protein BOTBODRAFT_34245 [Botryobasidium botryosum FD-172 SS1]